MKKHFVLSSFLTIATFWLISCKSLPLDSDIKVLSIEKIVDKNVASHEMCESFSLTENNIETYFAIAEEVPGHKFHHEALILPCKFKGSIHLHGENLQWEIFAGGAGYLYNKKSIDKRFICRNECCNALPNLC